MSQHVNNINLNTHVYGIIYVKIILVTVCYLLQMHLNTSRKIFAGLMLSVNLGK